MPADDGARGRAGDVAEAGSVDGVGRTVRSVEDVVVDGSDGAAVVRDEGVVAVDGLDAVSARGVQTVVNYPVALPFLPAYARYGHRPADFPVAHHHQSRILSLPIFPEISEAQLDSVERALREFAS